MRLDVDDLGGVAGGGPADARPGPDVGTAMSQLARTLRERHGSVADTLEEIVTAAVRNVPPAYSAGVTVASARNRLEHAAATDALPGEVGELQTRLAQGPCLEALHERRPVGIDDLRAETRWPPFTAGMAAYPVRSMLSLPLYVGEVGLGSLSLYAESPHAFDDRSREIGLIFASHAAVALAAALNEEGLRLALDSRDVIGQAKGILMERHRITGQEAFLQLVRVSQRRNVKLRELAAQLALTGSLEPDS